METFPDIRSQRDNANQILERAKQQPKADLNALQKEMENVVKEVKDIYTTKFQTHNYAPTSGKKKKQYEGMKYGFKIAYRQIHTAQREFNEIYERQKKNLMSSNKQQRTSSISDMSDNPSQEPSVQEKVEASENVQQDPKATPEEKQKAQQTAKAAKKAAVAAKTATWKLRKEPVGYYSVGGPRAASYRKLPTQPGVAGAQEGGARRKTASLNQAGSWKPSPFIDQAYQKVQVRKGGFYNVFGSGATASFIRKVEAQSKSDKFDFAAPFVREQLITEQGVTDFSDAQYGKVALIIDEILKREEGSVEALYSEKNNDKAVEAIQTFVERYSQSGITSLDKYALKQAVQQAMHEGVLRNRQRVIQKGYMMDKPNLLDERTEFERKPGFIGPFTQERTKQTEALNKLDDELRDKFNAQAAAGKLSLANAAKVKAAEARAKAAEEKAKEAEAKVKAAETAKADLENQIKTERENTHKDLQTQKSKLYGGAGAAAALGAAAAFGGKMLYDRRKSSTATTGSRPSAGSAVYSDERAGAPTQMAPQQQQYDNDYFSSDTEDYTYDSSQD